MRGRRKQKVVSLFGNSLPIRARDPEIEAWLEERMADARGGSLRGVVYGLISPEGHLATGWVGTAPAHHMLAATALLMHRIGNAAASD